MFFHGDGTELVHSLEEVAVFVDHLAQSPASDGLCAKGLERRAKKRRLLSIPIRVVPMDCNLHPIGPPFTATTRSVSHQGLSLIHYKNLRCSILAVELMDTDNRHLQVALKITRRSPVG